jgi:vitamin B12/bleomycin/antimicrobial peptide transport system ATP-binding/permease protein
MQRFNHIQKLQNSGMTFLSVGHGESLSQYHQSILDFTTNQTWAIKDSEDLFILPSNNLAEEGM